MNDMIISACTLKPEIAGSVNSDPQYILTVMEEEATPLAVGMGQTFLFPYALFGIALILVLFAAGLYLYRCRRLQNRILELQFRERIKEEPIRGRWRIHSLRERIQTLEMDAVARIHTE